MEAVSYLLGCGKDLVDALQIRFRAIIYPGLPSFFIPGYIARSLPVRAETGRYAAAGLFSHVLDFYI
jgi:hypothetical protein